MFYKIIKNDLLIAYRMRSQTMQPILFYILIFIMFPLALQSDTQLLTQIAAGIIWIASLLTVLLFLENLFHRDFEEGELDYLMLQPYSFLMIIYAKLSGYILLNLLPILVVMPFMALALHLTFHTFFLILSSLVLGMPSLIMIGAIAAALILGLPRGGLLLPLLLLPLYVPVLIFGASATTNAILMLPVNTQFIMLTAFLILALTLAPIAIAGALRMSVNNT